MKRRNVFNKCFALFVAVIVILSASPLFSDNRVDIEASNACLIISGDDSLSNRLLFKFDLPAKLNDKRIDYAEVVFYTKIDTLSRYSLLFAGYPVTTDWNKTIASWSSPWTNEGGDYHDSLYEIGLIKARGDGKVRFDITRLARRWQQQAMPNYGVIIIPLEEDRKITELVHPSDFSEGVFAKVIIYFSYTHP